MGAGAGVCVCVCVCLLYVSCVCFVCVFVFPSSFQIQPIIFLSNRLFTLAYSLRADKLLESLPHVADSI